MSLAVVLAAGCGDSAPSSTSPPSADGSRTPGVPAGTTLAASDGITVTKNGAVIDAMDISGGIVIKANNVTIKRSRIRGNGFWVIDAQGGTGTVVDSSEIDGLGNDGAAGSGGIVGSVRVQSVDIHGVENGVVPSTGSVITDSRIHDLASPGDPHYDGIQIDGDRSDITITNNTIEVPEQTAAVMIDNYFGSASNITVDGNRLIGGTYSLYSDGQFSGGPIDGVRVTNNRFGTHTYGYALVRNNSLAASSGNVDDLTGEPINL